MPFDGVTQIFEAADKFMADHNLTRTPPLARMGLRELKAHYASCCYQPKTNGVAYDVAFEDMFPPEIGDDDPAEFSPEGEEIDLSVFDWEPEVPSEYRVRIGHSRKDRIA